MMRACPPNRVAKKPSSVRGGAADLHKVLRAATACSRAGDLRGRGLEPRMRHRAHRQLSECEGLRARRAEQSSGCLSQKTGEPDPAHAIPHLRTPGVRDGRTSNRWDAVSDSTG